MDGWRYNVACLFSPHYCSVAFFTSMTFFYGANTVAALAGLQRAVYFLLNAGFSALVF